MHVLIKYVACFLLDWMVIVACGCYVATIMVVIVILVACTSI
jgi:hypothetical protein